MSTTSQQPPMYEMASPCWHHLWQPNQYKTQLWSLFISSARVPGAADITQPTNHQSHVHPMPIEFNELRGSKSTFPTANEYSITKYHQIPCQVDQLVKVCQHFNFIYSPATPRIARCCPMLLAWACLARAAVTDDAMADLKPNTSTCPRAGSAVD